MHITTYILSLVAGTVEEMSSEAEEQSGFKKGQKVMALVGGGGYAGIIIDLRD